MRTLVLTLALLGGCDAAPDAPVAPSGLADRSLVDRLDALEAQSASLQAQLKDAQATIGTLKGELDAAKKRQEVAEVELGRLGHMVGDSYAGGHTLRSRVDEMYAVVGGPGRQGGHLTVMTDYLVALAGDAGPSGTTDEALHAALFETDPKTGVETPRVDGAGLALAYRLRKRPEVLYQAWENEIDDYLQEIQNNPLHSDGSPNTNPLFGLSERVAAVETGVAHFWDDWQGEVAYLKIEDQMIWSASHDQRKRLDGHDVRLASLDGGIKEVKELADILKADYGKQIGGVQTEVDALWAEMVAADDALQKQLDGLAGEVCRVGDLSEALAKGDWVTVDECLQKDDNLICGTTDHL